MVIDAWKSVKARIFIYLFERFGYLIIVQMYRKISDFAGIMNLLCRAVCFFQSFCVSAFWELVACCEASIYAFSEYDCSFVAFWAGFFFVVCGLLF